MIFAIIRMINLDDIGISAFVFCLAFLYMIFDINLHHQPLWAAVLFFHFKRFKDSVVFPCDNIISKSENSLTVGF